MTAAYVRVCRQDCRHGNQALTWCWVWRVREETGRREDALLLGGDKHYNPWACTLWIEALWEVKQTHFWDLILIANIITWLLPKQNMVYGQEIFGHKLMRSKLIRASWERSLEPTVGFFHKNIWSKHSWNGLNLKHPPGTAEPGNKHPKGRVTSAGCTFRQRNYFLEVKRSDDLAPFSSQA